MTETAAPAQGRAVAVRVPATSANLGPGFDTLGLALSVYDELVVTALDGRPAGGPGHRRGRGIRPARFAPTSSCGRSPTPTRRSDAGCRDSGSRRTTSSRTAGGWVPPARPSYPACSPRRDFSRATWNSGPETLLRLATELEGHPDNVAPALFGGLTIAWVDESGPQHKKLLVHRGVSPLVFVPEHTMSTSVARSLQPLQVPREDAVFNVSRSALLIAALTQSPELMLAATEDKLHQSYRAQAMPETDRLVRTLRDQRFAAVVSGAGPSVLVLADGPGRRLEAADLAASATDTPWEALMLAVDFKGGTVRDITEGST